VAIATNIPVNIAAGDDFGRLSLDIGMERRDQLLAVGQRRRQQAVEAGPRTTLDAGVTCARSQA
jgi:hypothetical protein